MRADYLNPWRRHIETCSHRDKGPAFTLCDCPIHVYGWLHGQQFRRSLRTGEWAVAAKRIQMLLRGIEADAILPPVPQITVDTAIRVYLADAHQRNLKESSISSMKRTLDLLSKLCGAVPIGRLSVDDILRFRESRKVAPRTQRKEIEFLRAFCAFCVNREWLNHNPAKKLKPPRVEDVATLPFTGDEVTRLLNACELIRGMWKTDTPLVRRRARALVLTLLYSGLRIGDVAKLERSALRPSGHLVLRIMKTGVPLKVLLNQETIAALEKLPAPGGNPRYFFWTGRGHLRHCAKSLGRTISRLGNATGIHAHPHRFRDTFAVELLTNGAEIRTVQLLLGHESVKTTEKHYAHFVAAHQALLDSAVSTLQFESGPGPLLVEPLKHG